MADIDKILDNGLEKIAKNRLKQDAITKMTRTIIQGFVSGKSIQEMAKTISGTMDITFNDAVRILRTETHRLTEAGVQEQFKKAQEQGIKVRKKLVAVLDNRTRKQSAQMDGQLSDEEGRFKYPDGNWYIPGNTGHPEWDINDRERSIQVIEGYEPQVRISRDQGLVKDQTFEEWAKSIGLEKNVYGEVLF